MAVSVQCYCLCLMPHWATPEWTRASSGSEGLSEGGTAEWCVAATTKDDGWAHLLSSWHGMAWQGIARHAAVIPEVEWSGEVRHCVIFVCLNE